MILQPATAADLSAALAGANARGEKIESVDLSALNRAVDHAPEDMVVTADAGVTVAALQDRLAEHGQWLPIDPPNPGRLTIGELIHNDVSGPRRHGHGTIRNWLIGIRFVLADGTLVHSGGKVVKNVAGYDMAKLIIGSRATLGVTTEATFKLRPLPEQEQFVEATCHSLEAAENLIGAVLDSGLTPVVFDLHNVSSHPASNTSLVLGLAGTRDEVDWQIKEAVKLGFNTPSSLDYEAQFWADPSSVEKLSVLPSKMVAVIRGFDGASFVARAGNGVVFHRGPALPREDRPPLKLMRRLKDTFDPKRTLPAADYR